MIGTLNCEVAATIDIHDGNVRIDGLDGRASILKRCGDSQASSTPGTRPCVP